MGVRGNCGLPASLGKTLKESGKTKHPPVHNSSVEIPRRISAGAYNVARCDRLCPAASGADIFPGSKPSRQPSRQAARPGRAALRRRHPHISPCACCAPHRAHALYPLCAACTPTGNTHYLTLRCYARQGTCVIPHAFAPSRTHTLYPSRYVFRAPPEAGH